MRYFFDSYAIIELINQNENYAKFSTELIITNALHLAEVHYHFPKEHNKQTADVEVFDKPRTSVRGTLRASKSPEQTADFSPQMTQGLFDFWIRQLNFELLDITTDIAIKGSSFKFENKKKKLSYADCIGYVTAIEYNLKFLTGDNQFKDMEDVEFVK